MSNNGIVDIRGRQYKTVALRVDEFRRQFPISDCWSIVTDSPTITEKGVLFRASVLNPNGDAVATGTAYEEWGSSQINSTSCVENCETSAIGRALAAAGFIGSEFASADEVANAIHQQNQRKERPKDSMKESEQYRRFVVWIDDKFGQEMQQGEPWKSWDELNNFIESLHEIFEPAKLVMTRPDGELTLDWDKFKRFTDESVFRQVCLAIKAEAQAKKQATFA
jgi:hypothetical protein